MSMSVRKLPGGMDKSPAMESIHMTKVAGIIMPATRMSEVAPITKDHLHQSTLAAS